MAAPQSSPFAAILAAVVSRVATSLRIDPNFVLPVASDDYRVTVAEPLFVYVRPYGPQPFTDAGAGRLARTVNRRLRFYLYSRSGEDVTGSDAVALMGQNPEQAAYPYFTMPGHLVFEEALYNSIDDFQCIDVSGNAMTIGPLHVLDSASGPPVRKPENDEGLIRSEIDVQIVYVLPIDPTEPAP